MRDADRLARLGREVASRRSSLGLSVVRAATDAGINRGTWAAIESGDREATDFIYGKVEIALKWEAGSVERILDGGAPLAESNTVPSQPTPAAEIIDPDLRRYVEIMQDPKLDRALRQNMRNQLRLWSDQMDLIRQAMPEGRRSA
jgi:transcriptional regulator with XRE-family HTH domain